MAEWEAGLAAAPRFGSDTKILSEPSQQSPWYTLDVGGTTKYVLPYRAMRQASDTGLMSDNPYVWAAPGGQWGTKLGWGSKSGYHKPEIYNLEGFLGPAYESAKVFSEQPIAKKWVTPKESSMFEDFSPLLTIGGAFAGAGALGSGGLGNFLGSFGGAGEALGAGGAGTPAWWDFGAGAAGGAVEAGGTLATGALEQGLASGAITNAEALQYIASSSDGIEAIIRLSEFGSSAGTAAQTLGFSSADAALQAIVPQFTIPGNIENFRAPVEDASRTYDPSKTPFLPEVGNAAAYLANAGGAAPGTAASVGNAATSLSGIKNTLGLTSMVGQLLAGSGGVQSAGDVARTQRASQQAQMQIAQTNRKQVEDAFSGFDDAYYQSIADAFKNYYQPQVTDQFDTATRDLIYKAPGGVGSSEFSRLLGRAEEDRAKAGTDVASSADVQAQNARADVEGQRANLLGLAQSSTDPALFGDQAIASARASARPPDYSPLTDLFSRYATLAMNAGRAENMGYGRSGVPPINFGGGGSSVSVVQ